MVFRWREESDKLPSKYRGDGIGDIFHIAVVTSTTNGYEICHSSNSTDNGRCDKYSSRAELAARYKYAGTLKGTASSAAAATTDTKQIISLLEQAISLLKKL